MWQSTPGRWTRLHHLDLAELLKDTLPIPNELKHLHKALAQPQPKPTELAEDGDGGPIVLTMIMVAQKKTVQKYHSVFPGGIECVAKCNKIVLQGERANVIMFWFYVIVFKR